nr:hypothetical protein CFP56_51058 [Quercus suber]
MWLVSGSVAGIGTSGSANSMKVMELSPKGVGLLSERLEILGEQFQHGNPVMVEAKNKDAALTKFGKKLLDIDKAINVDYMSSNLISGKERVPDVSGNLSALRTLMSHAEDLSDKLASKNIGDKIDITCKSSLEALSN